MSYFKVQFLLSEQLNRYDGLVRLMALYERESYQWKFFTGLGEKIIMSVK
jgi:hypothetical protein